MILLDDKQLFSEISKGKKEAFDIMFKRYYEKLCRFAFLYMNDEDAAQDIVQKMFINLWNKRDKINIETSLKSYMYTGVKNLSINELQKIKLRELREKQYSEMNSATDNSHEFKTIEFQKAYKHALATLPPKTYNTYVLCKEEGLTYDEIAEFLGVSPKTVENNMAIALKKLRELLKPYIKHFFED